MKRGIVFSLLIIVLFIIVLGSRYEIQPKEKRWSVGILVASDAKAMKVEGFKGGLTELGFVEGENISYTLLNAQGRREQLLPLAIQLVEKGPDVLIATGGVEADALKKATVNHEIPIVFIGSASSVERGLIKSFLQPDTNITGVDNFHAELAGKRLELLKKLLPYVDDVAIIYDPEVPPSHQSLKIVRETAKKLNIKVGTIEIRSREELKKKIQSETLQGFDAMLSLTSFLLEATAHDLVSLSLKNRLPVMGIYGQEADSGFFAAYGVSMENQGRQGARLAAKVLYGQDPKNIPVETPDNLELIVNLRTADELGLKLDESGLSLAKIIIR